MSRKSARKKATKKKATKKKATKKKATKKKAAKKRARGKLGLPPNHVQTLEGIITPADSIAVVSPTKFRKGFAAAQVEVRSIVSDVLNTMARDFSISEIELSVSIDANGKFLGFGVGGAASIKIKVSPNPDDE